MAYDIQLLVQASLYFLIFILNFVVAIPIGVNVIELNDQCMLYTDINWVNSSFFYSELSSGSTCHFPIYFAVTSIFYSLTRGIYNMYVACRSKDPYIGYRMWVLPFIVLTASAVIIILVVSCILSVGLAYTCDGFMKGKEKSAYIQQCSDIQKFRWTGNTQGMAPDSFRHLYNYPKTSEIASWITFLAWTAQACLFILRFFRNRRSLTTGMTPDPSPPAEAPKSADMSDFASVQPAS